SVKRVGSVRYALTLIRSHFATDASQNRLNVFQCLAYLLFEIVRHHTRTRNLWALACDENETIGDYRLRTRTGRLGSFGDNDGFLHNRKSSIGCFQNDSSVSSEAIRRFPAKSPQSTGRTAPVIAAAASEAKKSAASAISFGSTIRPSGYHLIS